MPLSGGPITRAHIPSELEEGLNKVIFRRYALRNKQYEKLYNMEPSKKRQETQAVMAGAGTFQPKAEGNPPYIDSMEEAYSKQFIHDAWALAMIVTHEARQDDLYGPLARMADELGDSAGYTQSVDALDFLNDPTGLTLYTAEGTNYPLLSLTHFLKTGASWANRFAVATTLDIVSLESGLNSYRTNMVDQRGRKVQVNPKYLAVGVDNQMVATRLLGSQFRPGGDMNDVNAARELYPDLEPLVLDHLAQTGGWFLWAAPADHEFVWWNREGFNTKMETPGDGSRNLLHGAYYRNSHGSATPTGVYGSPGS